MSELWQPPKGSFIRQGSAKNIYRVDDTTIAFRFTNHFSVFDYGRMPDLIPDKALSVCACAVKSFGIATAIGVPTHFVEQLDPVTIRVKEARIITDRYLTTNDKNYVVPAEWIYRLRVAGSIDRDFRAGKKKPTNFGFPSNDPPAVGTPFPFPVHMLTTKFEDFDREITDEEAGEMGGLSYEDQLEFWSMIDRLTGAIAWKLLKTGFVLIDGKMECLIGPNREKMIGDVFCTPDEDRFCSFAKLINKGEVIHYSKEYLRQIYIENGWKKQLDAARAESKNDPEPPRLTKEQINIAGTCYAVLAEAYSKN
jgi:phosphoribosylaminoimidazole-succinocarboxamide synthase